MGTRHNPEQEPLKEEPTEETGIEGPTLPDIEIPEEPEAPEPDKAAKKTIFQGLNKSFEDPEELSSYARELEKKQIELEAKIAARDELTKATAKVEEPVEEINYAEMLFSDPEKAIRGIYEKARAEARSEVDGLNKKLESKAFWATFYEANPDLSGNEDIVDMIMEKNRPEWKDMQTGKAKILLADEARRRINLIKKTSGDVEELSSRKAVTAGATGASVSRTKVAEAPVLSFVDQMNKQRQDRRKRAG